MEQPGKTSSSSLFLVRLWQTERDNMSGEWSGRVVHITSGRATNCAQVTTLGALLLEMIGNAEGKHNEEGESHTQGG